ncbi:MAG: hypothetical protein RIR52_1713 [Acidobacteriota bacterium]|jgi:lysophospholipase L1-like esterase
MKFTNRLTLSFLLTTALCGLVIGQTQAQDTTSPPETIETLRQRIEGMERRLQDWPQFSRYRDANRQVQPPAKGEERVVFLGDSITDSWKLDEYFPGRPYINRGISGQTTPQMLLRMRPDVIALSPKVIVILAGTNDIAGNTGPMTPEMIQQNYTSIAELAKANGIIPVFASILPVHDYGPRRVSTRRSPELIVKLNEWLKGYCEKNNLIYLDYFSRMTDEKGSLRAELANDGLHPNAQGYRIMAPLAEAAIQQALNRQK